MASFDHQTISSQNTHFDSEEKFRYELARTVTLTPELYERLFISPKTPVAGDLRSRFGNPTPIGVLGFSVGVIPLAISFSEYQCPIQRNIIKLTTFSGMAGLWGVFGRNHYHQHLVRRHAPHTGRHWRVSSREHISYDGISGLRRSLSILRHYFHPVLQRCWFFQP